MSRRYALIIGNSEYDDTTLAQLKTPEADVRSLATALRQPEVGGFDEVQELINQPEAVIRRAISAFFANKKPDEMLMVYFSGHGVLDDQGRLFLAVKDTQRNLLKATGISASFITDEMDSCRSKRQLLILDCCHSGAFARGTKGDAKAVTQATFEGNGYGRVVLTASDSTQYALEGDQVIEQASLSLFTHYLLEGLISGEADLEQDGWVTLDEWYDYAYERVVSETPNQTPRKWVYNQQGELIIARNPAPRVVELPEELKQAIESKFVGIRLEALEELKRLLQGNNAALAQAAYQALQKMAEHDDSRRIATAASGLLATYQPEALSQGGKDSRSAPPDIASPTTSLSAREEIPAVEADKSAPQAQRKSESSPTHEGEQGADLRQAPAEAKPPAQKVESISPGGAYHSELSLSAADRARVKVTNSSDSSLNLSVEISAAPDALISIPSQARLSLSARQTAEVDFRIKPQRRAWFGGSKRYPFTVQVSAAGATPQVLHGEVISRPYLPSWAVFPAVIAFCLLCAYALFSALFRGAENNGSAIILETPAAATLAVEGTLPPTSAPTQTTPAATGTGNVTAEATSPGVLPPPVFTEAPPQKGQVVFASDRDGNLEIYRLNLASGEQVRLTNDPAEDGFPEWSPHGGQIVFHSNRGGDFEIYVMNADGGDLRQLTNDSTADTFPAWSPDGSQIIFQSKRDKEKNIYVMDANGANLHRLLDLPGDELTPRWSPDGRFIVFASNQTGNSELYLMNADGTNIRRLTEEAGEDRSPAWAPDSRRIAFTSNRNGTYDLFLLNVFSGELIRLPSDVAADENHPSWTPDGNFLVFTSNPTGEFKLYLQSLSDGSRLQLTGGSGNDSGPSIAP